MHAPTNTLGAGLYATISTVPASGKAADGTYATTSGSSHPRRSLSISDRVLSFRSLLRRFGAGGSGGGGQPRRSSHSGIALMDAPAALGEDGGQQQEAEEEQQGVFGVAKQGSHAAGRRAQGGSYYGALSTPASAREAVEESSSNPYGSIGRGGKQGPALAAAALAALQRLPASRNAQTLPLPPNHNQPHPPLPPANRRRPRQQVLHGDGGSHLLLLTGAADPLDEAAAATTAPPPALHLNIQGRYVLRRGTVGFLLSDARCKALVQAQQQAQAAAAAAAATENGLPPQLNVPSSSVSWRPPTSMRHRRLSSSLSVGSGAALAAVINNETAGVAPSPVKEEGRANNGLDVEAGASPARSI